MGRPALPLLCSLLSLTACPAYVEAPRCESLGGTWQVALDRGNGLVAQQAWTVAQEGCDLTITGDPVDPGGVGLGTAGATGWASWADLRVTWWTDVATCRVTSVLEGTPGAAVITGSVLTVEGPNGTGYCPGGMATGTLRATR